MAEYIEKEGVKKSINFLFDIRLNVAPEIKQSVLDLIDGERAADVQPVNQWISVEDKLPKKHGRWVENTYKYIKELDAYFIQAKCTVCGRYSDKIDIYTGYMSNEYCSHCGAKMDGDAE